jgi:hypothetical protein
MNSLRMRTNLKIHRSLSVNEDAGNRLGGDLL